jgi:transcriptional regulator with XRE-family HTH domain
VQICYIRVVTSATLIQQARRRAGMTQAELAGRVGTTQSAVARWERGAVRPTVERLESLVEACGLELELGLVGPATDELATLRRNLTLSVDERVTRIVALHRFVAAGRAAVANRDVASSSG